MSLSKQEQWHTRAFDIFLRQQADVAFRWGENDCCLFAANSILACTGVDIATDFRGKYDSEESAFALIKTVTGGSTVADAAAYCAVAHGLVENTHPLMAKRGDLVVITNGDTTICGVVHLNGRHVVSVTDRGLVRLPISKVVRSWVI